MRFRTAVFEVIDTLRVAISFGLPGVFKAIYASPSIVFSPLALSRISMAGIWVPFGNGGDEGQREDKENLITPHAKGVVLDIGAGHAHAAKYLDRTKVSKYVALEPNTLMHTQLRAKAQEYGFTEADDTLLILSCGAEDAASILSSTNGQVDTIISSLTLCSVPAPDLTIRALANDVLVPGGALLLNEHVRHHRADVVWWQGFWTPIWGKVFDGCCLDRPTFKWVEELVDESGQSIWKEGKTWEPANYDGEEESVFWRRLGRFVKKGERAAN
ncbi:S-adenosyl-L-methionine-dependent methyltransferase [Roridomyces roridus]|uniref:S-adenosyl-L-methionine-dependent methyltransferase n=1 Tax=Roridomyces roridus TaxID=1738132 RepID=A0AAD7FSX1_9AGAR|nr:S-adenosyl-L-methionine-dependent methyltransferase [Roridomyces roridus]